MSSPRIITLTTDFGTQDTFVGQMRGVVLTICPDAHVVDLTHEVPAHDVVAGAFALKTGYKAFPPGSIHVAVVDPGVGTSRRGVVVRTARYTFVAPDNGVLSLVLEEEVVEKAHVLETERYRLSEVSATFEGRDVFAPAAAWLLRGIDPEELGPAVDDLVRLPGASPVLESGRATPVRVLAVDHFGNVTLDVARDAVVRLLRGGLRVEARGEAITTLHRTYGDAAGDGPFLLFNSAGYLEIAVREGRLADRLGIVAGDEVIVTVEPDSDGRETR